MLKPGDPAPDFALQAHDGRMVRLEDFGGRKVLLWFYVEADTPGCRDEGCGFRDHQSYFDDAGIALLGISFDPIERNAAFAAKYAFRFPLLTDSSHEVARAYGACSDPRARQPDRLSFLIDERGRIERVYAQVDPRDHAARVLAELLDA
jgi:peroxiredoxin Q/BCP